MELRPDAAQVVLAEGITGLLGEVSSADLHALLSRTGDDAAEANRKSAHVRMVAVRNGIHLAGPFGWRV